MGRRIGASQLLHSGVGEAEALWYDTSRWRSWVDGFAHVDRVSEEWPAAGGVLEWDSIPNGRGHVVERVESQSPGSGQVVSVEDPEMLGRQEVSFVHDEDGSGTLVLLELEYQLKSPGPLGPLIDLLFIRRALRDSLNRTLARFATELDASP